MFTQVKVIGRGRVGAAIHARLTERGLAADGPDADLVLLCVPDIAIADVAAAVPAGPWIAHVSGATPLSALAPHERRFGLHALQTFILARGSEQLDGAWAAVTSETAAGRGRAATGQPSTRISQRFTGRRRTSKPCIAPWRR
jgi:hypothetical protein